MVVLKEDKPVTWLTILKEIGGCHCVFGLDPTCRLCQVSPERYICTSSSGHFTLAWLYMSVDMLR